MNLELDIRNHPYVIELTKTIEALKAHNAELASQIAWLKRQIHGPKSERRIDDAFPLTGQQPLLIGATTTEPTKVEATRVKEHDRKKSNKVFSADNAAETGLRFGPEVRVEEIPIANPAAKDLAPDEYEVVGQRTTERLCQEKSAYFIKRYCQPVIKIKETGKLINPPVIESIIDSPYADISVLIGLIIDKFLYYQPLYRQHQKMRAQGIELSRATLTTWAHSFIDLFKPVYVAQLASALESLVLSMDETPHKAGRRSGQNKMATCYFWFLYGDKKEVIIHNATTRGSQVIRDLLSEQFHGTLLSDGYPAYKSVTAELNLVHASCWAHARRKFIDAEKQEPQACKEAVAIIRQLYEQEATAPIDREKRLEYRIEYEKPIVDKLFDWLQQERKRLGGLPKTNYSKSVNYALERDASLKVFLSNPDVPIDNNHTERAVRYQVMARKNYLFCWSELGADKVAIIQSLFITCQLHDIDPWQYLTDVATRIQTHPQARVQELIPRNWKLLFAKKIDPPEIQQPEQVAA